MDTTVLQLRFSLHADARKQFQTRWNALKYLCESGNNSSIVTRWLEVAETRAIGNASDRCMLARCEGGIGGDSNVENRQIRFCPDRYMYHNHGTYRDDMNDIKLVSYPSGNGMQQWTAADLMSFGRALKYTLNRELDAGADVIHLFVSYYDDEQDNNW